MTKGAKKAIFIVAQMHTNNVVDLEVRTTISYNSHLVSNSLSYPIIDHFINSIDIAQLSAREGNSLQKRARTIKVDHAKNTYLLRGGSTLYG